MLDIVELIAGSNAFQIISTAGIGGIAYLVIVRFQWILTAASILTAALLTISFAFDLGEVYSYSSIYKRAYWWFGDDVTVWLGPLMIWAVLTRRPAVAASIAMGIVFSGGRVAIVLLLLQYISVVLILKQDAWGISKRFWGALAFASCAYVTLLAATPYLMAAGNWTLARATSNPAVGGSATAAMAEIFTPTSRGNGNCRELETCIETKVSRPFQYRAYGAVAGLWMTLEGGYQGSRFPNTAEKFAELMIEANPWGINDRFGIDHEKWRNIGTIQTPYLQFGAGYGPWLLALLVAVIGVTGLLGVLNIRSGETEQGLTFTVFFIVNAVFNQTQAWMNPGPILFLMGLAGAHIILTFIFKRWRRSVVGRRGPEAAAPMTETLR